MHKASISAKSGIVILNKACYTITQCKQFTEVMMLYYRPAYEMGLQDGLQGKDNSKTQLAENYDAYCRGLRDAPLVKQQSIKPKLPTGRQHA